MSKLEEIPPPPPKSKAWNLDFQTVIATAVVVISFCALFVSVRQAGIMNKQTEILIQQTKASSWPRLELELDRAFQESIVQYKIILDNKGTGPAIIEGVRVTYDGMSVTDWEKVYNLMGLPDTITQVHNNSNISNKVLSANDSLLILDLSINPPLMQWVFAHGDKLTFEICYKSVFDDYWIVRRKGFQSNLELSTYEKVEGCSFKAQEQFRE